MNFNQFNFAHPTYLLGLLVIPIFFLAARGLKPSFKKRGLEAFADRELLPHLLRGRQTGSRIGKFLPVWSLIWTFAVLALAGPRWDFVEIPTFKPTRDVVVALDLSRSMDGTDVRPSRLARAKERVADLVNENPELNVGLVAFAGDAHLITPVTEDRATIDHLLPALQTDLITVPGRDLDAAVKLATETLRKDAHAAKAILVMSDGFYPREKIAALEKTCSDQGIQLRVMDFNHSAGEAIRAVGLFGTAGFASAPKSTGISGKDWEPRFYIFLIPAMLLSLLLFRRRVRLPGGFAAAALLALFFTLPAKKAHAEAPLPGVFLNHEMRGARALHRGDFKGAAATFTDPYRKGVAQYRAGEYAAAADSFAHSSRPEVATDATYNLGNAMAEQGKYPEAIEAYKKALAREPNFVNAQKNLKIVEDLLKKQPPPPQQANQKNDPDQRKQSDKNQNAGQKGKSNSGQDQKQAAKSDSDKKQGQPQEQRPGAGAEQKQPANAQARNGGAGAESTKPEGAKGQDPKAQEAKTQEAKAQEAKAEAAKPEAGQTEETEAKNSPAREGEAKADATRPGPDKQKEAKKYARDVDADQWLNLVRNDPHAFLKNQFMIESARARAQAPTEER